MITSLPILALKAFEFIQESYGFRCVISRETLVRWESNRVFVQILYDTHRSYEVGLEINLLTNDAAHFGPPFSLSEIMGVAGFALADRPFFQASTEERLKATLEEIAQLLNRYGAIYLQGNTHAFGELAEQRQQDCDAYEQERRLKWMREAADKAWQNRDYKTIVGLYNEHKEHLTDAEAKRYQIALRQVESSVPDQRNPP